MSGGGTALLAVALMAARRDEPGALDFMSMSDLPWSGVDFDSQRVSVTFSEDASRQLKELGWLTRRLVERTVKDELLAPSSESPFRKVGTRAGKEVYELPVGNFSVRFETASPDANRQQTCEQTVLSITRRQEETAAGPQGEPPTEAIA